MGISYYSIFQYDNDGICISFPDLPECLSCAWSDEDAKKMAQEALELYIEDTPYERLPKPSCSSQIILKESQKLILITTNKLG
ncbi:MAG: type II toxin-antitoxin system HicB family antitoxin [Defluviitaleaceae bacterium]|nr:type II toxin-antitoxin system HicB family antitoxin [Defluviitaleaceae bacterium]